MDALSDCARKHWNAWAKSGKATKALDKTPYTDDIEKEVFAKVIEEGFDTTFHEIWARLLNMRRVGSILVGVPRRNVVRWPEEQTEVINQVWEESGTRESPDSLPYSRDFERLYKRANARYKMSRNEFQCCLISARKKGDKEDPDKRVFKLPKSKKSPENYSDTSY